jgi:peptide/nickel transport system permease protein
MITILFFSLRILPGDPVEVLLPPGALPETIELLRHTWGLDRPLHVQYLSFLTDLFRGDLGRSRYTNVPVLIAIMTHFPTMLQLAMTTIFTAGIIGIPFGILLSTNAGKYLDHLGRVVTVVMYSVPVFVIGVILQLVFALNLGLLPVSGTAGRVVAITRITGLEILDSAITGNLVGLLNSLKYMVLPTISLSMFMISIFGRLTRTHMIEELGKPYITTARAKGISKRVVAYKHAFRNALLPIFTIGVYQFAALLGGAVVTETIFSLPGLGLLLVTAIENRDFPLIQGCLVFYAVLVLAASIFIDVMHYLLNPKLRS